jgi:flagellar basal-body rod protein FlgB
MFIFIVECKGMDPTRIGLFDLAEKRLGWLAQRQGVLAGNIANVNTPGFAARDIQPFTAVLAGSGGIEPVLTQPGHMPGTLPSGLASLTKNPPSGRSLDGNSVALDEQLTKVADSETTQSLVTSIWKKYVGMFNTALGRSG